MSSTPSPSTQAQPADQRARKFVWPLSLSAWKAVDDSWAPPSQQPKEYEREKQATAARLRRKFVWPLSLRVWNAVDDCWAIHKNPSESSSDPGPTPQEPMRLSMNANDQLRVHSDYVLNSEIVEETDLDAGGTPKTNAMFVSKVKKAYQNTSIEIFFKNNPKFIEELAGKAAALADDPHTPICGEKLLSKTVQVTMHQQVLYCYDGASAESENRDPQNKLIKAIARVTTRILPEGEGVYLQYDNQQLYNPLRLDFEELVDVIKTRARGGDTPIDESLKSKVLEPLVYSKLPHNLLRPLLISVITDGVPDHEPGWAFIEAIAECGDKLVANGLPRESVKFMISQASSATGATRFLLDIATESRIANVVFVASENIDVAYSKLKSDWERDEWLIETLYAVVMQSESKKDR